MRKLKVAGIVAAVALTVCVIWMIYNYTVDAKVVADTNELIEQQLTTLTADDPIIRRYGAFKNWERGNWSRPQYLGMLISRLETRGVAHFEKADEAINVIITSGPTRLDFEMTPSDGWLQEQPDTRKL